MKPFVLVSIVAITLCGCADGNSVSGPTAPSQSPTPKTEPAPPSQPPPVPASSSLAVALSVLAPTTVNQPAIFIAAASPSANGTLDFGDGTQVLDFVLDDGVSVTLKHGYARRGTFVATLTVTNAAGQSVSIPTTITIR